MSVAFADSHCCVRPRGVRRAPRCLRAVDHKGDCAASSRPTASLEELGMPTSVRGIAVIRAGETGGVLAGVLLSVAELEGQGRLPMFRVCEDIK